MRDIPDQPFDGWEPPGYRVDERGKVVGAQPGPHHNWGRSGDDDQRGTFNHLTPERIVAAASLIRTGKRFSLALPIGLPTPGGYRSEPLHFYGMAAGDGILGSGRGGARYPVSDTSRRCGTSACSSANCSTSTRWRPTPRPTACRRASSVRRRCRWSTSGSPLNPIVVK